MRRREFVLSGLLASASGSAYCWPSIFSSEETADVVIVGAGGAGLAAAATAAGLAVSFVAALGYRRRKMTIEEAKEHWTPAQRKRGEEYLREAKKEAAEQERRENAE